MGLVLIDSFKTSLGIGSFSGGGGGGGSDLWTVATTTDASYTAGTSDERVILADCSSNNVTVNLPAANSSSGEFYHIKKIDSSVNIVTIDGNGAETIDGEESIDILNQWVCLTVACDGNNWFIV